MSMRTSGEEGHSFSDIESTSEASNLGVTPTEELARLETLLCPASVRELDAFITHSWTLEKVCDYESHYAALPESWRNPLEDE